MGRRHRGARPAANSALPQPALGCRSIISGPGAFSVPVSACQTVWIGVGSPGMDPGQSFSLDLSYATTNAFSSVPTDCEPARLPTTGEVPIGATLAFLLSGVAGQPSLIWLGILLPPVILCPGSSCAMDCAPWLGFADVPSLQITVPCDASFVGVVVGSEAQGRRQVAGTSANGAPFHLRTTNTLVGTIL